MGYNTTVVVLNDALSFIEEDPEFGKRFARAISEAATNGGRPVNVAARSSRGGVHCNAATVVETHHAGYDVFVKVGRNCGEVVKVIDRCRSEGARTYHAKLTPAVEVASQEESK